MHFFKTLDKVYSYQFRNYGIKKILSKQIKYHKKNYSKYFALKQKEFKGKIFCETGAGSGMHGVILSKMVGDSGKVFAYDKLKSNIKKIKNYKKIYKLKNFVIEKRDLRHGLNKKFKYIAMHNWVQHTPNPSLVFKNISKSLEVNGRLYIATYHYGTFRFFITQIARKIVKINDLKFLIKNKNLLFKDGFKKYENYELFFENLTDDFFTPFCVTTNYKDIIKLAKSQGLKPLTKAPKLKKLYLLDNHSLKMGFIKKSKKKIKVSNLFKYPKNEFKITKIEAIKSCIQNANKVIRVLSRKNRKDRSIFCMKMYKIRCKNNKKRTLAKYQELNQLCIETLKNYQTRP